LTRHTFKYVQHIPFSTRRNITQLIYFWKTALHVSGGIFTHHQEKEYTYDARTPERQIYV